MHVVHTFPAHTGLPAGHCVDDVHATHVFVFRSHTGVAPVHADAFVASHGTHSPAFGPLVRQAGLSAGHAKLVPDP